MTPKARPVAAGASGRSSVAVESIDAGDVVAAFGGRCLTRVEFDLLPVGQRVRSIQIQETLFLAGPIGPEPADFINHSCDPNCGMSGSTIVVALRNIEVGDALSYDYATSDGCDYDEFECSCGSVLCRGKVTGYDWMLPELQIRYRGYFSPYLAARIAALATIGAERRAFAY
ncbi:MAG: SET domain-containing protein-lysine N-methyltransferase [Ilumatobacteraceae bacterium]|nr:SET domain-containing protein-lysine N-methyltransferase [Ilumatobacteraceae bacterium]